MGWLTERVGELTRIVERLLSSPELLFDSSLRSNLPEEPGLYAIYVREAGEYIRAGRADAAGGLRQRVYQNHFMGDQEGNLRSQLVRSGRCSSLEDAKSWIRNNCAVRVLVVRDDEERRWGEHFMLSVLRPRFSN
jgi:hypothetical protein